MIVTYDIEKINALLEDFFKSTDININLLRADFSYVGGRAHKENNQYCRYVQKKPAGNTACHHSDKALLNKCKETKKTQFHVCHAGLVDAASPILYGDVIIGYVIFGEMKIDDNFSNYEKYLSGLGLDSILMKNFYTDIPVFDLEKIKGIANIASMLGKHILLEKMLIPDFDEIINKTTDYIDNNLTGDLSIINISKSINVSKSVLYKRFHKCFGTTISEYINSRRIEKSIDLLQSSDLSIEEISQRVGFSSASYYSKIFKKIKGTAPLKYRKNYEMLAK